MRSLRSLGGAPTIHLTLNTLAFSQGTADTSAASPTPAAQSSQRSQ